MRRLLIFILCLGGIGVAGFRVMTGRLPWVELSPEEQQVAALRAELDGVREQWKQAGRAASFGTDTTTLTETAMAHLDKLESTLTEMTPRLQTPEARRQADRLGQELAAFKQGMR